MMITWICFILLFAILIVVLLHNDTTNNLISRLCKPKHNSTTFQNFDKSNVLSPNKPIYIFIHICNIGSWNYIFDEIINNLLESGLYEVCEQIFIGCSCPNCVDDIKKVSNLYHKITVLPAHKDNTHENGTINYILKFSQYTDAFILYLHSKGVTNKTHRQHYWRNLMMFYMIKLWHVCIRLLRGNILTVGHQYTSYNLTPHYSGNFWWANTKYLRTLPLIQNMHYRYNAEIFIMKKSQKGKHASIGHESWISLSPLNTGLYSKSPSPQLPSLQTTNIPNLHIEIY